VNKILTLLCSLLLLSCGGGDGPSDAGSGSGSSDCSGRCFDSSTFLRVSDVERIIAQAVNEARARGVNATIAVVDRVGNVLGVFRMNGADTGMQFTRLPAAGTIAPGIGPARRCTISVKEHYQFIPIAENLSYIGTFMTA